MSQVRPVVIGGMTRRGLLGVALLATASATTRVPLFGQQMQSHLPPGVPRKPRGPTVFLDYDQEELDAAYDQAPWAPNQAELTKRNMQKSEAAVARLGPARRLAYGPTAVEQLDLYTARKPGAPINVFIHGGAWRVGDAAYHAYKSEMFVDAGAHFIALDFNNVLDTNGNLMPMAEQVRRAVAWIYRNAARFGGDSNRLYVSGHSSGGHLAAVVLTTDWEKDFGLPRDTVKGGLCASGMYGRTPSACLRGVGTSGSPQASSMRSVPDVTSIDLSHRSSSLTAHWRRLSSSVRTVNSLRRRRLQARQWSSSC